MNRIWLFGLLSTIVVLLVRTCEARSPDPWRPGSLNPVWFGEPPPSEIEHVRQKRSYRYSDACPRVCTPVCGSNGLTYCNKCHALCLGIQNEVGACEEWITAEDDCCAACERQYMPVCACGRVYYNPCVAECMEIHPDLLSDGLCT